MPGFSWKKIKEAEVYGKGSYLPADGFFKLKLLKMYTYDTRDKGAALIVDFEVLESDHERVAVGAKKNWYQSLQDKDVAFSSVKEFMLALFDVDQSDEDELEKFNDDLEDVMDACADEKWEKKDAEDHPLHGRTIAVQTSHKKTKRDKDFTVHDWEPWSEEEDD